MIGQSIKNPGNLSRNFNNSENLTTFYFPLSWFSREIRSQESSRLSGHGSRFLNREAWSIIDAKY